jgi:hypothetical protein
MQCGITVEDRDGAIVATTSPLRELDARLVPLVGSPERASLGQKPDAGHPGRSFFMRLGDAPSARLAARRVAPRGAAACIFTNMHHRCSEGIA